MRTAHSSRFVEKTQNFNFFAFEHFSNNRNWRCSKTFKEPPKPRIYPVPVLLLNECIPTNFGSFFVPQLWKKKVGMYIYLFIWTIEWEKLYPMPLLFLLSPKSFQNFCHHSAKICQFFFKKLISICNRIRQTCRKHLKSMTYNFYNNT